MELNEKIILLPGAVFLKKEKLLAISDVHIGFEEYLNKQGLLIPRTEFERIMLRVEKLIIKTKPKHILINGDLKHEFGTISEQEWRHTIKFLDFLQKNSEQITLVRGNHDTILGPIAQKKKVVISEYYVSEDIYFCHGNAIPKNEDFKNAKTIIIGHEHPAITLSDGIKRETYKCFAIGKWKNKKLIVMPSFHKLTTGTDLLKNTPLSPFLKNTSTNDFDIYISSDKIYKFGKLKNLK